MFKKLLPFHRNQARYMLVEEAYIFKISQSIILLMLHEKPQTQIFWNFPKTLIKN
jgi:hypothetical protein